MQRKLVNLLVMAMSLVGCHYCMANNETGRYMASFPTYSSLDSFHEWATENSLKYELSFFEIENQTYLLAKLWPYSGLKHVDIYIMKEVSVSFRMLHISKFFARNTIDYELDGDKLILRGGDGQVLASFNLGS